MKGNLELIARNLVGSLCQYFGIPFLEPRPARQGVVDVNWGSLNIRSRPELTAPILARPTTARPSPSSTSGRAGTWCSSAAW